MRTYSPDTSSIKPVAANRQDDRQQLGGALANQVRASIILPVMDETELLRKTVSILLEENSSAIQEILIVVSPHSTKPAIEVCRQLAEQHPTLICVREQTLPFLGGAIRDAFDWASGTHVLMMASDLETDPHDAKEMIRVAGEGWDIVTATRWTTGGGFKGYNPVKFVLNWVFQKIIGLSYGTRLTDLTYGYRIFRLSLVKTIAWEELRHPFLLETVIKPLRLGASIAEIPSRWVPRTEGESHNTFLRNFDYFRIAWKTRFQRKETIQKAVR
jgi:glycosyltransferase involved in cell wall biosynthesis